MYCVFQVLFGALDFDVDGGGVAAFESNKSGQWSYHNTLNVENKSMLNVIHDTEVSNFDFPFKNDRRGSTYRDEVLLETL